VRDIAIVADHEPMATAQRRWYNHHSGFSGAWPLNNFFTAFYATAPQGARRDVFYVPGENNLADSLSRSNRVGDHLRARRIENIVLPGLEMLTHPFAKATERPDWQV
jgi:hypothetical protein